jgi:hypothetical protein
MTHPRVIRLSMVSILFLSINHKKIVTLGDVRIFQMFCIFVVMYGVLAMNWYADAVENICVGCLIPLMVSTTPWVDLIF